MIITCLRPLIILILYLDSPFVGSLRSRRVVPQDKPEPPLHPRLTHIGQVNLIVGGHLRNWRNMHSTIWWGITIAQKKELCEMINDVSGMMISHSKLPKAPFGPCRDASVRFIDQLNELVTDVCDVIRLCPLTEQSTTD